MKKITIIYLALMLALPVLLHAQYLGGNGRGDVMLESLNNPLTNTGNNNTTIPTSYSLSQNYPNPFNPTTNVQFSIIKVQFVSLKVFDMLGKEVATLVNETLKPGTYEAAFDGSQLPSGVYFARLEAGSYNNIIKMLMFK
ncbi:MAG: T9SS type A sorting domain-containing protein [Ignavibacteriae bacterium]|nr:T9SS type A sorting domain-containing protein [Ignavibacteriota bacterium]